MREGEINKKNVNMRCPLPLEKVRQIRNKRDSPMCLVGPCKMGDLHTKTISQQQ